MRFVFVVSVLCAIVAITYVWYLGDHKISDVMRLEECRKQLDVLENAAGMGLNEHTNAKLLLLSEEFEHKCLPLPHNANADDYLRAALFAVGEPETAATLLQKCVNLDPLNSFYRNEQIRFLFAFDMRDNGLFLIFV
jgi:hypothetical protein